MASVLDRLRGKPKPSKEVPYINYTPPDSDRYWGSPSPSNDSGSYYPPPPAPSPLTDSNPHYQPSNSSTTTLRSVPPPPPHLSSLRPIAPEGWHLLWIPHQSNWAFEKDEPAQDGSSISTWNAESPFPSSSIFAGARLNTMDLLKIYMSGQPHNAAKPLIDRNIVEKEGVEWGISESQRSVYNSIYHVWPNASYISLFAQSDIGDHDARRVYELVTQGGNRVNANPLTESEFAVAMHLIYRILNDYPLPALLPPQLVSILSTGPTATVGPKPGVGQVPKTPPSPKLPENGDWSGRGQHVEYSRGEAIPLTVGDHLGRGASADVHKVTTSGGVVLARKLIYCARAVRLDEVKRELEILRKVNHKHIIKLVGSFTQGRQLGILLKPAAVCDLGTFLDEIDEQQRSGETAVNEQLETILEKLGTSGVVPNDYNPKSWEHVAPIAHRRLRSYYGCLASGLEYLHQNDIRHKDIKTRNILLDKGKGLFITDFGISRDNTDVSTSVTNGIERGTYKYCAPEVATYEPRGRAADIYSLGCVFLEMETVYCGISLLEFDKLRKENDVDSSFQANPEKLIEWMEKLRLIPQQEGRDLGIFHLVDLIQRMLSVNPESRPKIDVIRRSLATLGNLTCKCDIERSSDLDELSIKYTKVKRIYFDNKYELDNLTSILDRLWASQIISPELKSHVPDVQTRSSVAFSTILNLPDVVIAAAQSSSAKSTPEYLTASELKQENLRLQQKLMEVEEGLARLYLKDQMNNRARETDEIRSHDE